MAKAKTTRAKKSPLRIVILQRGWIVLGRVTATRDEIVIDGAAVIRRWGTTAGLGQLATAGRQPNTVLDECPPVRAHPLAVVGQIDCVEAAWPGR